METVTAADDGDASGFTSIGLPPEAGWYASAALYWIGGLAVVLINQLSSSDSIHPVIGILGATALAATPLLLLGARYRPDAMWGVWVRILSPILILGVGAVFIGGAISALVLLVLFPVMAVAYMHKPVLAIPYCTFSIAAVGAMLLVHDHSDPWIARAIVLTGVSGAMVAGLIASQSRLRTAAAKNHERSITDPLTGLANLRGLRDRLQQEIRRSARDESEVVIFAIDLDDFKEVNDRFSYALGDAVLQAVAQVLVEESEPSDLVARRGGDEFAILAIAAPGRHMARFGDRIAAAIERTRRAICPAVTPTASVSRTTHEPGESVSALIQRVDDGLHTAKIDAHPERAGSELPTTDQPEMELDEHRSRMLEGARRVRSVEAASGSRERRTTPLEWRVAAGTALASAVLIGAVMALGLISSTHGALTWTGIATLVVVGVVGLAVAGRRPPRIGLQLLVAVTMAAVIGAAALSGSDRFAVAEICVLPIPLAVVLFGRRETAIYAVVGGLSYAWLLLESGEPYALLQVVAMLGIMATLVLMLDRGEGLAAEFSATAEALSVVDPLTGTGNLRGFHQRVSQEIARAGTTGQELCVTMVDLDRFKDVNDRYSHSMGDALLFEVARAIERVVREDELVARRGGDEFAVVSSGAPVDAALSGRITEAVLEARMRLTPDLVAGATAVSVVHQPGEELQSFLDRADQALHDAKARQRGGVVTSRS